MNIQGAIRTNKACKPIARHTPNNLIQREFMASSPVLTFFFLLFVAMVPLDQVLFTLLLYAITI